MSKKEKIEKLKERERFLITRWEDKNRVFEENKKALSVIEDKENNFQQETENIKINNDNVKDKLNSKILQLKDYLAEKNQNVLDFKSQRTYTISKLMNDIQILNDKLDKPLAVKDEAYVFNEEFLKEVAVFRTEVESKQQVVEDLQNVVDQLTIVITNNETALEKLIQNNKLSRKELSEAYDLFNGTQEDFLLLKNETHNSQNIAACSQGNSLFDEVNDSRVDLQQKLADLKKKCKEMDLEISLIRNRFMFIRQQQNEMNHILQTQSNNSTLHYNFLVTTYKDTISRLKKVSMEYNEILVEKQQLIEEGVPTNVYNFYDKAVIVKEKTHSRLNEATSGQLLENKLTDIEVREKERTLREKVGQKSCLCKKIPDMQENVEKMKLFISEKANVSVPEKDCTETKMYGTAILPTETVGNRHVEKKKVQFAEDIAPPPPPQKKAGKVLQYKSIHFPSLTKKK